MDTKVLEKFCPWARVELIDAVDLRCRAYALDPEALAATPASADVVAGRVLSPREKAQRASLAERIQARGYDAFCEQMAYTWFNRFAAIRYMELHDYLPGHVRMLSAASDGGFAPDCIRMAANLPLPGLDAAEMLKLMSESKDEEVFRRVIIAQCNELAECLPEVFGQVDEADALTLPDGLLRHGEHSVLFHLVTDIPEDTWENVEVLGWMYQFYNAQVKDAFFKSKRKATAADIAPATQLFTPEWIVRYMVENSLGRLWMLNRPESSLRERMEYYIEPDEAHEDFVRIKSPEDITLCDPACGSGHILSYAFELLFAMYEECGYMAREIPELILTKNLSGYEIDPRAAQIASLVLALRAREHDRRFFRRDVRADVRVLASIPFEEDECGLPKDLAEELSHLGEVGSLLSPTDEDMDALRGELAEHADDLFSTATNDKLKAAIETCDALRRRFDIVVANPPYMGSSSFNPFMSKWVKKNYPDVKSDLCTCFIERGYGLAKDKGYAAMVTMQSWMFLGSFEKMRNRLIAEKSIVTMAHLGPRAFDAIGGEVVSVTADVLYNSSYEGHGAYFRLVDINGSEPKRRALLEAIHNPTCGYFYRRNAETFHTIPSSPIAYWVGQGLLNAFSFKSISSIASLTIGLTSGDNSRFYRTFWEVSYHQITVDCTDIQQTYSSTGKWYPANRGGNFRRWYGNQTSVINWANNGAEIRGYKKNGRIASCPRNLKWSFHSGVTWNLITSDAISARLVKPGSMFDQAGCMVFPDDPTLQTIVLGLLNSSVTASILGLLNPTLNCPPGVMSLVPWAIDDDDYPTCKKLVNSNLSMSKLDWDSFETSWDFKRSPLL